MNRNKLLAFIVIAALIAAFFSLGGHTYLTRDYFISQQAIINDYVQENWTRAALIYFVLYVMVTGLSLPGAAIMTLAGGAIFGLLWGTVLVSFASSFGATLAFMGSRFLLRDWVQGKFGGTLKPINDGIAKEGAFYLFALRLVPAFPFFMINLVMGLTSIKIWTFYWVSQIGMLAGTIVFVYAGAQLGEFKIGAGLIFAFVLLGIFPLLSKKVLDALKARKVYAKWQRPARFERNVVVIGAGSAGLVTAYIAAAVKAKVTLIEKHQMGGDCLNTGCVPSKALIRSAKLLSHVKRSKEFGIRQATAEFDFTEVMERVQGVIKAVEPHDSAERYSRLGVECVQGDAKIVSPWEVSVKTVTGEKTYTTKTIVIAAGAHPFIPPIPGLADVNPLTSDNLWNLRKLPKRLVVLGGGPIGAELTQCFARFGSQVTQVEMAPRILIREDPEVSDLVMKRFQAEGVNVLVNHKAKQVVIEHGEKFLVVQNNGADKRIAFDEILCAVGRMASVKGYGLEELGIPAARVVEVNEYLETIYPNIYACGDVAGPYQFTHTAAHMAWYCAVNALFGNLKKFKVDYSVVPWCTFTDPEVARVGLNESEAREKNIPHEVYTYGIDDLDRAIADGEAYGLVKVITPPGSDRILGVTIAGEHAGDLLVEYIAAMKHGFGLNKILGTIHIYPTLGEANKYAAGVWKKAQTTQEQLRFTTAWHEWRLAVGLWPSTVKFFAVIGKSFGMLGHGTRAARQSENL